jgi:homoserine dehydrogenase
MDVRIALTGFGNVGQGLATLLARRGKEYQEQLGVRVLITGVADRAGAVADSAGLDPEALLRAKIAGGSVVCLAGGEPELAGTAFLDATSADVLVEAASTNFETAEPGWGYVRNAMERGMDVVFASKGSLALHHRELMELARKRDRRVLYSATIGAPLPSLEIAERALIGTTITSFEGIVNATSHQILTVMAGGASYEDGVRQAQEMGIAETDPTLDVDGWDAAAKVTILANTIFDADLKISDVERTGIRGVTPEELRAAEAEGQTIKLVGRAERQDGTVKARVSPERRGLRDALGRLSGDDMGFVLFAEPLGKISTAVESSGSGGGITTAMTVLRDIFNLARERGWASTPRK